MPSELPRFTLRIQPETLRKLIHIAEYNGRSTNREIEFLIKQHIESFEKIQGKIEVKGNDKL